MSLLCAMLYQDFDDLLVADPSGYLKRSPIGIIIGAPDVRVGSSFKKQADG